MFESQRLLRNAAHGVVWPRVGTRLLYIKVGHPHGLQSIPTHKTVLIMPRKEIQLRCGPLVLDFYRRRKLPQKTNDRLFNQAANGDSRCRLA